MDASAAPVARGAPPLSGGAAPRRPARAVVLTSAAATAAGLLVALAGRLAVAPGVPAWPQFWASAFFTLLFWPIGLGLLGVIAGWRPQAAVAALLVVASATQQFGMGTMPLPLTVRWSAALAVPGDAIRHQIALPPAGDAGWERALTSAARLAVLVCTEDPADPEAAVTVQVNDAPPVPLAGLTRTGRDGEVRWYELPIAAPAVQRAGALDVVVRRGAAAGAPLHICGAQTDPPHAGRSARWRNGAWSATDLADRPLPPVEGRPAPSRYYVELRAFDAAGRPSVGIWY